MNWQILIVAQRKILGCKHTHGEKQKKQDCLHLGFDGMMRMRFGLIINIDNQNRPVLSMICFNKMILYTITQSCRYQMFTSLIARVSLAFQAWR